MAVTLGYSSTLSNVTIAATVLGSDTDWALVERSSDGGSTYDQVRGAAEWEVTSGSFAATLNDYEFSPNEVNTYRVSPYDDTNFTVATPLNGLVLDGTSGDYASTGDAASLDITGDLELQIDLYMRDWTPASNGALISKWVTTGNQRSYQLWINTVGDLKLTWSTDGTAANEVTATATVDPSTVVGDSGRLAIKATLDVDNGAAGKSVRFYTASTIDGTWTQLGSTVTTAGTTSIFAGTAPLEVGSQDAGTGSRLAGVVHTVKVLSGIAGTAVANPDFSVQDNADTSFADTATPAKTWTVHGAAEIVRVQSNTTTPTITDVWLKSMQHPFLNRAVRVVGYSDVTRANRSGIFDVMGRTLPVAVTELRSSRRFEVTIRTDTRVEFEEMDLILASGDVMLLQSPPDTSYLWLPANIYVSIGDVSATRHGTKDGVLGDFTLPCTEVAQPDLDTYGISVTWATILAEYSTWQDLIDAFTDWGDVLALVGSPEDIIVP